MPKVKDNQRSLAMPEGHSPTARIRVLPLGDERHYFDPSRNLLDSEARRLFDVVLCAVGKTSKRKGENMYKIMDLVDEQWNYDCCKCVSWFLMMLANEGLVRVFPANWQRRHVAVCDRTFRLTRYGAARVRKLGGEVREAYTRARLMD